MEVHQDFDDATRLVECSVLIQAVVSFIRGVEGAAGRSLTAALLRKLRITHIYVVATSFYVMNIVLLQFVPGRLAPVKPLGYGMALAFAVLVIAVGRMTTLSRATASADSSAGTANAINN